VQVLEVEVVDMVEESAGRGRGEGRTCVRLQTKGSRHSVAALEQAKQSLVTAGGQVLMHAPGSRAHQSIGRHW
jgi:hypothetical protein